MTNQTPTEVLAMLRETMTEEARGNFNLFMQMPEAERAEFLYLALINLGSFLGTTPVFSERLKELEAMTDETIPAPS